MFCDFRSFQLRFGVNTKPVPIPKKGNFRSAKVMIKNMAFRKIDIETWERREFYEHFISQVVCSYSVSVNLDITHLKGQKLYPAMIWLLTKTVNDMPEFRT